MNDTHHESMPQKSYVLQYLLRGQQPLLLLQLDEEVWLKEERQHEDPICYFSQMAPKS